MTIGKGGVCGVCGYQSNPNMNRLSTSIFLWMPNDTRKPRKPRRLTELEFAYLGCSIDVDLGLSITPHFEAHAIDNLAVLEL